MSFVCEKPSECPVCYEPLETDKALSCGHWVHKTCIIKSKKDKCPMCREKVKLTRREREDMLMTEQVIQYSQPLQEEELPYTMPNENTIVTLDIRRRFRVEDDAILYDGRVISENGNKVKIAFTNQFEAMNFCAYIEGTNKVNRVLIDDLRRNTAHIQTRNSGLIDI
jgi:uncharacterized protein YbaR (Trm112 family)